MPGPAFDDEDGAGPRARPLLRTMFGDVLRRNRREQGRTLEDVARSAKISMPYLSEVERGRKEASSEVLAAVCDALRLELSDVLAEVGRDLAADRARRERVLRLDVALGRRAARPARRAGDTFCLAA
ncbi:helix-turn-helix transcriptional regulator [Actinocorallia aurantiaca]|uniref:HTH cro/C1-type domain-containing protein n=1 Tax=Actinocorallia aurantiaca TaxID=46204 RepID=A0ABP6GT26_9ACTN